MTEERWRQLTYWPLLVSSVIFIVVYSWQVIADLQGTAYLVARVFILLTWVSFAVDYTVRLGLAHPRGPWFRRHIFDLLVVVLPVLKPLRLLKALTLVHMLQQTAGTALRSRIAIYGSGAAAVLIWVAALAELEAERGAAGANIETFGDAIWWAFVTVTTVGYGDFYPVTPWGRTIAVLLMCGGVALVGVVTATLASWVLERAAIGRDADEPATRGQLRDVAHKIDDISARLPRPPAENADAR
ncbi:potassium channel family protein [Microbacterium sp. zg.B48]|uniref:potassium channel family protein n=1 Tax=unclassified Microbacterium TaxID=2609290 RepID=UPI00214B280F|nr:MULTISPECIES: potassium channel family protein [unclassified Microbacterium]MCR2762846.1 potassium channel family protein [Microbacterium sp. zg.B48]MCR2808433.1 potassium channel family protein [Microbacterium sp. zg.B185]WIM19123.1 potassium channel family protein [Microbacterium sp. zg-B185]